MRFAVALFACTLLAGSIVPVSNPAPVLAASDVPLQEDFGHPLWAALRATGLTRAEFAQAMLSDRDGNRVADFLDLMARLQPAGPSPLVELLVRGDAAGRAPLLAKYPGAAAMDPAVPATFLTAPLADAPALAALPGVERVLFEPRAYVSNTNPSGGSPGSLSQITLHQGNGAWGLAAPGPYTGSGVKIAILDTGVDTGHQALDGGKVTAFKDCTSTATMAYDDHGHGTHVASIAAGDDGTDFRGIAYQADVVAVKILDAGGDGTIAWFQCAVDWVRNSGSPRADVASMSAGLGVPPLGITTLNGGPLDLFGWDNVAGVLPLADVPFAVAAGNWVGAVELLDVDETTQVGVNGVNQVSSPAMAPQVVAVGAVSRYGNAGAFTGIGPGRDGITVKPDVAAMGVDTWGALRGTTNDYAMWDGTSMATPLAAGVLALLVDKDASKTATAYRAALRNGADPECIVASSTPGVCYPVNRPHPRDPNFVVGWGVVKATNSLAIL